MTNRKKQERKLLSVEGANMLDSQARTERISDRKPE